MRQSDAALTSFSAVAIQYAAISGRSRSSPRSTPIQTLASQFEWAIHQAAEGGAMLRRSFLLLPFILMPIPTQDPRGDAVARDRAQRLSARLTQSVWPPHRSPPAARRHDPPPV